MNFFVIFALVLALILVLFYFGGSYLLDAYARWQINKMSSKYDIPVLTAIDLMTYKDCNPPPGANTNFFWYNFEITEWNANTLQGKIKVATYEDLGMQEGNVVFTANFAVQSASTIVLSEFVYSNIIGTVLSRMDPGPWTISITQGTGAVTDSTNTLLLSGRAYAIGAAPVVLKKSCATGD